MACQQEKAGRTEATKGDEPFLMLNGGQFPDLILKGMLIGAFLPTSRSFLELLSCVGPAGVLLVFREHRAAVAEGGKVLPGSSVRTEPAPPAAAEAGPVQGLAHGQAELRGRSRSGRRSRLRGSSSRQQPPGQLSVSSRKWEAACGARAGALPVSCWGKSLSPSPRCCAMVREAG